MANTIMATAAVAVPPAITTAPDVVHVAQPIIPLITIFTPPTSCTQNWFYDSESPGTVWDLQGYDDNYVNCQPFNAPVWQYSPGVCRSGLELVTVSSYTGNETSTSGGGGGGIVTHWQGFCCSPGFTISTENFANSYCRTSISGQLTALMPEVTDSASSVSTLPGPSQTVLRSPAAASGLFVVFWQETDLAIFPTEVAAGLASIMGIDTSSSLPFRPDSASPTAAANGTGASSVGAATPTNTTTQPPTSTAYLTNGAIAGISVGVSLVFILLVVLGYLAFVRNRRRGRGADDMFDQSAPSPSHNNNPFSTFVRRHILRRPLKSPPAPTPGSAPHVPEMESPHSTWKRFSGGAWRSELHADTLRHVGLAPVHEAEANEVSLGASHEKVVGKQEQQPQQQTPVELDACSPVAWRGGGGSAEDKQDGNGDGRIDIATSSAGDSRQSTAQDDDAVVADTKRGPRPVVDGL